MIYPQLSEIAHLSRGYRVRTKLFELVHEYPAGHNYEIAGHPASVCLRPGSVRLLMFGAACVRGCKQVALVDTEGSMPEQHEPMLAAEPIVAQEAKAIDAGATPIGTGLCLSGGGYRAILFHLGALSRLNQAGMLRDLAYVSSVSGGSITAAFLGMRWKCLKWNGANQAENVDEQVIEPIMTFAERNVDVRSFLAGVVTPFRSVGDYIAAQYDEHLFDGKTLQDLRAAGKGPTFVINATSVQTGKLVRFSKAYIADYTVGMWHNPTTTLAEAVTASSAFPPVLSPYRIKPSGTFDEGGLMPINGDEFRERVVLTDGGVYDNLGLQTAWSHCRKLLVSDGGGAIDAKVKQPSDWARHGIRVAEVIDSQVRALRKRQLIEASKQGHARARIGGSRPIPLITGCPIRFHSYTSPPTIPRPSPLVLPHSPSAYDMISFAGDTSSATRRCASGSSPPPVGRGPAMSPLEVSPPSARGGCGPRVENKE